MISDKRNFSNLIPDYLHGLLDEETLKEFEQELAKSTELQNELAEFKEFEKLYNTIEDDPPEPSAELFDKIMLEIDEQEQVVRSSEVVGQKTFIFSEKIADLFAWLKESVTLPWGVAVVQAVALVILLMPATQQENKLTTLSSNSSIFANMEGVAFNVVFQPSATEAEIRKLLLEVKGRIAAGPSSQGKYVILLSNGDQVEKMVQQLQQNSAVLFVEKAY